MATTSNLGKIHVFPSIDSYETNKSSVGASDLALVPITGTVIESYTNGTDWYRIWSDGTIQQGGQVNASGSKPIRFLKAFSNDQYVLVFGNSNGDSDGKKAIKTSSTSFSINVGKNTGSTARWGWYATGK